LACGRVDNGDVLGSTTLRVGNHGTLAWARRFLLADRSITHTIVELHITVELGSNVNAVDRECGDVAAGSARLRAGRAGRETRAGAGVGVGSTRDTFSRCTREFGVITLAEGVGASESAERKVTVAAEWTRWEIAEVPSTLLGSVTLIVCVRRTRKRWFISPATGGSS
jgi:hypothetical protein